MKMRPAYSPFCLWLRPPGLPVSPLSTCAVRLEAIWADASGAGLRFPLCMPVNGAGGHQTVREPPVVLEIGAVPCWNTGRFSRLSGPMAASLPTGDFHAPDPHAH